MYINSHPSVDPPAESNKKLNPYGMEDQGAEVIRSTARARRESLARSGPPGSADPTPTPGSAWGWATPYFPGAAGG